MTGWAGLRSGVVGTEVRRKKGTLLMGFRRAGAAITVDWQAPAPGGVWPRSVPDRGRVWSCERVGGPGRSSGERGEPRAVGVAGAGEQQLLPSWMEVMVH